MKDLKSPTLAKMDMIEDDAISLSEILIILSKNIKRIFAITFIFLIVSIFYLVFYTNPVYTSYSKLMNSGQDGTNQAAGLAAQFGISLPTTESEQKWVFSEVLNSRKLARSVLRRNFKTDTFGKEETLFSIFSKYYEIQLDGNNAETIIVQLLQNMINIREDKLTSVLTLSVDAFEPKLSSKINEVFLEELDLQQKIFNKNKTNRTKIFIKDRILDSEKELNAAEENLRDFMDRNRGIERSPALQLEKQRLNREVSILAGVLISLKQQLETVKIQEVKESDYVLIVDPPVPPLSKSKPNKKFIVVIAVFTGILIGVFYAFIDEYFQNISKQKKQEYVKARAIFWDNLKNLFF